MQQQTKDIITEIDPDFLKYNDVSEDSMVIFGKNRNIMLISYQAASLKCLLNNSNFINFCREARYLVFDEAHFILDDSMFNKGINFFVQNFLQNDISMLKQLISNKDADALEQLPGISKKYAYLLIEYL